MPSAAAVVLCALSLLGRSERNFPPITLLEAPPPDASPTVEAFVRTNDKTIYVITSSEVFRAAQDTRGTCSDSRPLKKLASVLAHEEYHVLHGFGESDAYAAQLTTLIRLGIAPDNALYISVVRSMLAVLKKQNEKPAAILASEPLLR